LTSCSIAVGTGVYRRISSYTVVYYGTVSRSISRDTSAYRRISLYPTGHSRPTNAVSRLIQLSTAVHPSTQQSITSHQMQYLIVNTTIYSPYLIMQNMSRTTTPTPTLPPTPNTTPMELTQTFQSGHLVPNTELVEANNTFLRVAARVETILLRGVVDQHSLPRLGLRSRRRRRAEGHDCSGGRRLRRACCCRWCGGAGFDAWWSMCGEREAEVRVYAA